MSKEPTNFKELVFLGSSKKALSKFPKEVKRQFGFDLDAVQGGETPPNAKRLKGLINVLELVKRYDSDTYRAVYTVNIG